MFVLDTLTEKETKSLQDAQDKVTVKMLDDLEHGEEVKLNEDYTLYRYMEDDIIVINKTDEWEEVLQILYSDKEIIFEAL